MKWFRSNIKRGSRLALFALAIQFVLSFGHFRGVTAAEVASFVQSGSASDVLLANKLTAQTAENPSAPQPASDQGSGEHICAICAVMAMANTVSFATPPVVLLPQAVAFSYVPAAAESVRVAPLRVGFQPRAPPIS